MTHLILLRHGQSQWNLENRFTGFHDIDLTQAGEAEAVSAGRKLAESGLKPDVMFTSVLKRAMRTGDTALAESGAAGIPVVRDAALNERDYGDLTGLNKDETRAKYGDEQVHIWRRSYDVQPPGGESLADVVARVTPYFKTHIEPQLNAGKTVLVAAHGNSLRAMLIVLGLYTPDNINEAEIPTGTPYVFEWQGGAAKEGRFL